MGFDSPEKYEVPKNPVLLAEDILGDALSALIGNLCVVVPLTF